MSCRPRFMLIAIAVVSLAATVYARTPAEIEADARQLDQQVQGTTDLGRLQQLMQQAQQLQGEMEAAARAQGIKVLPSKPAATAEKEIERRREVINTQFRQFQPFVGARAQADEEARIAEAIPIEGRIVVEGGETANETRGVIPMDLRYMVEERFVGNLLVMHLYDAKKGQFSKNKEYMIDTLSTDIRVANSGGRKCVKWSSGLPGSCTGWASFSRSEVDPGSRYPQFYAGVVLAATEEGKVEIEAKAPDVNFSSPMREAAAKLGCFGAKWEMTAADFEKLLDRSEIVLTKEIGRPVGPSPGCRPGSTMKLIINVKPGGCAIDIEGDGNLVDDCMGHDGMSPSLHLKALRGVKEAPTATWQITEGVDKAKFRGGVARTEGAKAELRAAGPSRVEDDIVVEAEVPLKGGQICVARRTFTSRRPSSLRRLSDPETVAVGIAPYVNYKQLCAGSGCVKPDIPVPGREHLNVTDGYKRVSANEVLDQFDKPIRRDGLLWYEERVARVGSRKIEIAQASEGVSGTAVPVNPGEPNGPTMQMLSNDGTLEKGGLVVDLLQIMYLSDSSGVPEGFDITVDQKIRVFSCPVAECVQHYMKADATHVCKPPRP